MELPRYAAINLIIVNYRLHSYITLGNSTYSTIVMINIIIAIIPSLDEEMRSVKVKNSPKIEFIASVLDHSNQLFDSWEGMVQEFKTILSTLLVF